MERHNRLMNLKTQHKGDGISIFTEQIYTYLIKFYQNLSKNFCRYRYTYSKIYKERKKRLKIFKTVKEKLTCEESLYFMLKVNISLH